MQDRLVWLLERFELRARVFQAGPLAGGAHYDPLPGTGYLHVLEAGRIRVHGSGHRAINVDQPCALLYANPVPHRVVPRGPGVRMVCAAFEFGLGSGNPLARALPAVVAVKLADMPSLSTTLTLLFGEAAEQHCGREAILDRLMEVALVHLFRDLMDQGVLEVGVLAGLADRQLMKALNAMHENPAGDWTVTTLAAVAGMSRARFAVRFRDIVGVPPGEYLIDWRMGLARSLMLAGHGVGAIASRVGYSSGAALSRAFHAHCGRSPSAWTKQRRAELAR